MERVSDEDIRQILEMQDHELCAAKSLKRYVRALKVAYSEMDAAAEKTCYVCETPLGNARIGQHGLDFCSDECANRIFNTDGTRK